MDKQLYEKFAGMFPDFASGKYSYIRLESDGFEPLSLEWISGDRISVMHTYQHNGDLCYDPMMEFRFDNIGKTMSACAFEQSIPPLYQYFDDKGVGRSVDGNGNTRTNNKLQSELDSFASQWLENIAEQGFMPVRANLVLGEDNEIQVTFDADGNPTIPAPEPEKAGKQYDLGYGFLGNGITVWNRAEEINGNYASVAHIAPDRTVTIYDNDIPDSVREIIESVAQSPDTWAFGFSPAPESEPDKPKQATLDLSLPDPMKTISEMNDYGYTYENMLPLSNLRAVELFDADHCIYLLYPDDTEVMAGTRDEIRNHDGLCGIERADWERSPIFAAQLAIAANSQGNREADLLYGGENKFGIYQVRDGLGEARDFRFVPMRELEALGLPVERENYELVYTAPFSERIEFLSDRYPVLNKIYQDFNVNLPADYTARSVSVSDVIVLRHNGDISAFYVDSAGFKELTGFLGEESKRGHMKTPEAEQFENGNIADITATSPPDPALDKLEADVKAGKSISIMDLSKAVHAVPSQPPVSKVKPSLLGRLDEAKRTVEQNKHMAVAANKKERGHE